MWKSMAEPGRTPTTIRHMRIACWTTKATDTHSEYVILIAFPHQQWLGVSVSVLRYTYFVCCILLLQSVHCVCCILLLQSVHCACCILLLQSVHCACCILLLQSVHSVAEFQHAHYLPLMCSVSVQCRQKAQIMLVV